jgi:predicted RND superfamily exporter protein
MENQCGIWVTTHPRRVLAMTGLVAVFLIAWIPRIEFNDQFVNYFDPSIPFRSDTDFAAKNLSGIYHLKFSVKAEREGNIAEPAFLKRLDAFAAWLRRQPEVTHVNAIPDIMKRLNRNMNADQDSYYKLPETRELAAQYLLLFEMSLPRGLDLGNQINIDRTETRVIATLKNITTYETQAIRDRAEDWLRENMAQNGAVLATGPAVMFAYIYQNNIRAMFKGTAIALVLISLCLLIALRNVRLGLISIIPNAVPALMAFGIWSIAVGQAGLAAAVVTAITLGLIVDNTVHFLSKYQWARDREQQPPREAALTAYRIVGPAVIGTSAILVLGFIVLSFSSFQANAQLGMLSVITILCALATDLLTLPALLITIDRDAPMSRPQPNAEQS